ncbi:MAG: hypothetical protein JSW67_02900 [Candidatus Latescibacterota bacterium]|nr:MAG: hypothetical protein JSW67_02900 [Candidatus Latescibacterota bacterium]
MKAWEALAAEASTELAEARLQTHWAAQLVAAFGDALVEPRPDDSHSSMGWDFDARSFVGERTPQGWRASLTPATSTLALLDDRGAEQASLPLHGLTLQAGLTWMAETFASLAGASAEKPLKLREYEMPPHDVAAGATFRRASSAPYEELARWYGNAARFCEAVRASTPGASPVRCWPHHFDIATLVTLDRDEPDPERARSIGFGMTPGDDTYPEPYFYLNPWPRPKVQTTLPGLAGGAHWHTRGWIGAVLTATELGRADAARQGAQVEAYVRSGMKAAQHLLEA